MKRYLLKALSHHLFAEITFFFVESFFLFWLESHQSFGFKFCHIRSVAFNSSVLLSPRLLPITIAYATQPPMNEFIVSTLKCSLPAKVRVVEIHNASIEYASIQLRLSPFGSGNVRFHYGRLLSLNYISFFTVKHSPPWNTLATSSILRMHAFVRGMVRFRRCGNTRSVLFVTTLPLQNRVRVDSTCRTYCLTRITSTTS